MDSGDHASGFRHHEVIRFINNEVLMNGGGPDFYLTFRSGSWNEVEDQLRNVVSDPYKPRALKRAYAWSALALNVRMVARQQEQQLRRIQRLQEQVEQREAASSALTSELHRLLEERKHVATQLCFSKSALQHAIGECDMLRSQLLQADRSTQTVPLSQADMLEPEAGRHGATACPMVGEEQEKMVAPGVQGMLQSKTQRPDPVPVVCMTGAPSPWSQAVQTPLPVPVPHPFHAPLPVGVPYSTRLPAPVVLESEAAAAATTAVAPQMPPPGICRPSLWDAVGAPQCDQRCFVGEENPENLQREYTLNNRSEGQEQGPVYPVEIVSLGDIKSQGRKQRSVMPLEADPTGNKKSHSKKVPEKPQNMPPQGGSKSPGVRKSPKNQQVQGQKAKRPKGKKAANVQHLSESVKSYSPVNWVCPSCKVMNFLWRTACYKCKKVYTPPESGDLDPGQAQ